jgi:anti-anti-sigma regulatory factor
MPITLTTDHSGRRALVSVPDDVHSTIALVELLPALRWTGTDDIVVDLSRLESIDLRIAVVLASAKRYHDQLGRGLAIACRPGADARALATVGLDRPGILFRSLADAGWPMAPPSRASSEAVRHRRASRVTSSTRRTRLDRRLIASTA